MWYELLLFVLIGLCAGTLTGMFGLGGGTVIVPSLALVFLHLDFDQSIIMHVAASSSLCIMIFTTSTSVWVYQREQLIDWDIVRRWLPGLLIGSISGVLLADGLSTNFLKTFFGIFLMFVALRSFIYVAHTSSRKLPEGFIMSLIGGGVGMISGMLGVGSGVTSIPLMTACNISLRKAAAISSACSLALAIMGTLISFYTGANEPNVPELHTGYINWIAVFGIAPASMLMTPVGAHLSKILPAHVAKRIFAVILFSAGVHMLFR